MNGALVHNTVQFWKMRFLWSCPEFYSAKFLHGCFNEFVPGDGSDVAELGEVLLEVLVLVVVLKAAHEHLLHRLARLRLAELLPGRRPLSLNLRRKNIICNSGCTG